MKASPFATLMTMVFAGLLVFLAIATWRFVDNRRAARSAADNLGKCNKLAKQIELLAARPTHASREQKSPQDLSLTVQKAARIAEFPEKAVVRIDPEADRRVGKTAYSRQPTRIVVRNVTLASLVKFLEEVSSSEAALQATAVRLTAPRTPPKEAGDNPEEVKETWSAEVTLTHLLYSPEYAATQR